MVDSKGNYVLEEDAKNFTSKHWSSKIRSVPKVVRAKSTEPPLSLFPALKVEEGCQLLDITHAISQARVTHNINCKGIFKIPWPDIFHLALLF